MHESQKIWSHYLITDDRINKIIYCGQSVRPAKRWYDHQRGQKQYIDCHMQDQGIHHFSFDVVASSSNQMEANSIEIDLVKQYHTHTSEGGFNVSKGGNIPVNTTPVSEETKLKHAIISKIWMDEHPEHVERLQEAVQVWRLENGPTLKSHSDKTRSFLSEIHMGDLNPAKRPEVRAKMSASRLGRPSPKKGKPGVPCSEETKQKLSEIIAAQHASGERDIPAKFIENGKATRFKSGQPSLVKKKWSEEQVNEICLRYENGETSYQIAKDLKCSPTTINTYIKKYNPSILRRSKSRGRYKIK